METDRAIFEEILKIQFLRQRRLRSTIGIRDITKARNSATIRGARLGQRFHIDQNRAARAIRASHRQIKALNRQPFDDR